MPSPKTYLVTGVPTEECEHPLSIHGITSFTITGSSLVLFSEVSSMPTAIINMALFYAISFDPERLPPRYFVGGEAGDTGGN